MTVLSRKSVFYPTSKFAFTLLYFFLSLFLPYFDLHIVILTFISVFMFLCYFFIVLCIARDCNWPCCAVVIGEIQFKKIAQPCDYEGRE